MSVWSEGFDAYQDGLLKQDNPFNFEEDSDNYWEWLAGWQEAQYVEVGAL